jgi:hypothetical protein
MPVAAAASRHAERVRQVLARPHQSRRAQARLRDAADVEDALRRLGREEHEPHRARLASDQRLEVRHRAVDEADVVLAAHLGHDVAVRVSRHGDGQVVEREAGLERVDPDELLGAVEVERLERVAHHLAGRRLVRRHHRVLEVEDQRVGAGLERLLHLVPVVAGDEQQRAAQPRRSGPSFAGRAHRDLSA